MELNIRLLTRGLSGRTTLCGIAIFLGLPRLEAAFLAAELALFLIGICLFVHFSREFNRFTEVRLLEGGGMGGLAVILAWPAQVWVGQQATPATLAARLQNALYADGESGSDIGTFKLAAES